jgi:protocatechuate 3,4-dioxygenase beta subunit
MADPRDSQPPYLYPPYEATRRRAPSEAIVLIPATLSETTGPVFGHRAVRESDADLTCQHGGAPAGQRIIVSGVVRDEDARPVRGALVELWQANAAGRYRHKSDPHGAPLDPNFTGCGRALTDDQGRYRFVTIRPGAYPWGNAPNAWRPAHIHFSLFGSGLVSRLVTQMYFPGDPLLEYDPIFQSIPGAVARQRLVSTFDWNTTLPNNALGFHFDIVLRGRTATPLER